ncbi:MAG: DUF72 domain-containing protein [Burkholderiales bacterium]
MRGTIYIGTSGWTYDALKNGFYAGIPRSAWLTHYAQHFHAVEVNAIFYHQLRQSTGQSCTRKSMMRKSGVIPSRIARFKH